MGLLKTTVIFQVTNSHLPRDRANNVLYWLISGEEPNVEELTDAAGKIIQFWTSPAEELDDDPLATRLARYVQNDAVIRWVPVDEATGNETAVAGEIPWEVGIGASDLAAYPAEVACCLSYQVDRDFSVPAARQRGRLYLGPLGSNCAENTSSTTLEPRPHTLFRQAVGQKAADLLAIDGPLVPGDAARWALYSRAEHQAWPVTHGWVDNAFDTQRRRGTAATARNPWAVG